MVITYHGDNYFKITSGDTTILLDPTNQRSYKGASLILFTEKNFETREDTGGIFLIDTPGEFEIGGIRVHGWTAGSSEKKLHIVYRIIFDDISLALIGNLQQELGADFKENFETIDIAIVPTGGTGSIEPAKIAKFLRQIEPGLIVPAESGTAKHIKEFFKEFGEEPTKCEEKLVIKKKDIAEKAMRIVCLKSE